MPCILLHRLYIMERLKWQQKCANAADRGDRVQSVRNRVYSIIYSSFISVQFVGVHLLLLRVNHACKACTASIAVAVGSNLDKPLEAAVVEQSRLPVVHCSSLTGLLESWSVACSFIVRPSARLVAPASLVHRWSFSWSIAGPSAGPSRVPLAVALSLVHQRCIADASLVRLLVHRSSVCLCTARPSDGPSVGVTIAAASLGRRVPHQWKARMLFWCCRRRNREGL